MGPKRVRRPVQRYGVGVDTVGVKRLDPTLDLVFKRLLTRESALLRDMLEGVLARPIGNIELLEPNMPGDLPGDKEVHFDIHARIDGGPRVDLEMQRRVTAALVSRFVYYTARDYGDQLGRGDPYHLLTPSTGIIWLGEPLVPTLDRLHTVFELRERDANVRLTDQIAIHLLQLPYASTQRTTHSTRYTASVDRWARFFLAKDEEDFEQLAAEHPIMRLAVQTLDQLSREPDTRRWARNREDELKLYQNDLAVTRAQGKAEGEAKGRAQLLLKLLGLRFGSCSPATRARVEAASREEIDRWAERVLSAPSLEDVLSA